MLDVLRASDQERSPAGTLTFEGEAHGSGVSFFLVDSEPGFGPGLHVHPYSETWIVRSGKAQITAAGKDFVAETGDIVVVGADTAHAFKNIGPDRLDIICVHASPRMITDWLDA